MRNKQGMQRNRRRVLSQLTGLAVMSVAQAVHANVTPRQSLGPFYPVTLPLDSDADLTFVEGRDGRASGLITNLSGQVMDSDGNAVSGALIEIWQCDAFGAYHHPRAGGGRDPFFQGYGKTTTDESGRYRFKTIRPVAYPGRAPHIHVKITNDYQQLVTQIYVRGEPANDRDFLLNGITDLQARESLIIPFARDPSGSSDELIAEFNPVMQA